MGNRRHRVVWITGASSGIGRALVETFAGNGDQVAATARRKNEVRSLANALRTAGGECRGYVCDVRSPREVAAATAKITKELGPVDLLINNAGVTYFKSFASTTLEEFDHVVDTGLRGAFIVTKSVLPSMLRRRTGTVINIISYAARTTYTKSAAYSAAKSGLKSLMDVLREEVRQKGIKVINVYPGAVLTPMWSRRHRERYAARMMMPREIAELVYVTSLQARGTMVEELVVRPQGGDLRV